MLWQGFNPSNTVGAEVGSTNHCSLIASITAVLPDIFQASHPVGLQLSFNRQNFMPWDQWEVCASHMSLQVLGRPGYHQDTCSL